MKKFKKALAAAMAIVSAVSALCMPISASAEISSDNTITSVDLSKMYDESGFRDCANVLLNDYTYLGIEDNLFSATVGTPFSVALIDDDMNISSVDNRVFFPIIDNENIVSFITASKSNGEVTFSTGTGFSSELTDVLSDSTEEIALLSDEAGNIYAVDDSNNQTALFIQDTDSLLDISVSFDNSDDFGNVVSFDMFGNSDDMDLSNWYDSSRTTYYTAQISDYTTAKQSGANCWAYALLSLCEYKLKGVSHIEQIYGLYYLTQGKTYVLGDGAKFSEIYDCMKYSFNNYDSIDGKIYSPTKTNSKIADQQIIYNIKHKYPVYIVGNRTTDTGDTVGHAVVLTGYKRTDSNAVVGIYYMNPQSGDIQYTASNSYFESSSLSYKYTWNGSITLKGTLSS